jgi:hypothetical protein
VLGQTGWPACLARLRGPVGARRAARLAGLAAIVIAGRPIAVSLSIGRWSAVTVAWATVSPSAIAAATVASTAVASEPIAAVAPLITTLTRRAWLGRRQRGCGSGITAWGGATQGRARGSDDAGRLGAHA